MKGRIGIAAMVAAAFMLATAGAAGAAEDVSDGVVKIGILTDMSGVYADAGGKGSVAAAEMAIADAGGEVLGKPIKLISADHQNKPSLGSSIARKWIDKDGVDMIAGLLTSSVALAVQKLASEKGVITISEGPGATELTEEDCTKYGIHYVYDTYSLPVGTATAVVKNGGKTWFFITADYAFGHSLQQHTTEVVDKLGGKVLGSVDAPLSTADFSSYLLQAQASGAEVIALANAGQDTVNAIKQANAFGIVKGGQQMVGMLVFLSDVKSLGLKTAQGLQFTTAFYWDRNEASRKWSKRFMEKTGHMPTMVQAGMYSAVANYIKAVKAAGTDDGDAVRAQLGKMKIHDFFAENGKIEPNGLMRHDMYLVKVKTPEESKGPWDLLDVVSTIPGDVAYIPLADSVCPLLKQNK